jgi:hypothetical protein
LTPCATDILENKIVLGDDHHMSEEYGENPNLEEHFKDDQIARLMVKCVVAGSILLLQFLEFHTI